MSNDGVDLGNLEDQVRTTEMREQKVKQFNIQLTTLLTGAILSLGLNLLVKPLSLSGGQISYGSPIEFPLSILTGMCLILIAVTISHEKRVGYDTNPVTRVRLDPDSLETFTELKRDLAEEARLQHLKVTGDRTSIRIAANTGRGLLNRGDAMVFEAEYNSSIDVLTVSYNQQDTRFRNFVELTQEELDNC